MTRRRNHGLNLGWDALAMGWEAQQVIAMRLMKLSLGGPEAAAEAQRMVSEKVDASTRIGLAAMRLDNDPTALTRQALDIVTGPVRSNHRRLAAELRRNKV